MWKRGSLGDERGWDHAQAHDMMFEMRKHSDAWWAPRPQEDNPVTTFLESFVQRMGEKAADALVPTKDE